jgi:hypothetical protein
MMVNLTGKFNTLVVFLKQAIKPVFVNPNKIKIEVAKYD